MSAEKRSVSAPEELFAQADARQQQLGYSKFSDYIQALIRADVIKEGGHVREVAPQYQANSSPGLEAAKQILGAAVAHAHASPSAPPLEASPVKYPVARRSKKKPKP